MKNDEPRLIYILLDGVGDLSCPSLGNKTPLEAAKTPNLDRLTRNGALGDAITVGRGIAPESDIAVFNMLGYTFGEEYPGRGVIESIGANVDFINGDLALRGNFATLDDNGNIIDRRAGRNIPQKDSMIVARELEDKIKFSNGSATVSVTPTVAHRVSVRIRVKGTSLFGNITNTDPAYERIRGMGVARAADTKMRIAKCTPLVKEAELAAKLVNEFSEQAQKILGSSQVNVERKSHNLERLDCILLRDAGASSPKVRPINKVHSLSFSCIVDMPVEIGIANVLGMTPYKAGSLCDYNKKAQRASEAIKKHNVMYVHLKGPDEFGHDGDAAGKMSSIEEIDAEFFASLLENIDDNVAIAVSADHSTPCTLKSHSDDPVPVLVSGNMITPDQSQRMTESEARTGSMGHISGSDVLGTLLEMIKS